MSHFGLHQIIKILKYQKQFELELLIFCRKSQADKLDFHSCTSVNHIDGLQMYVTHHQYSHYCFLSRLIFLLCGGTWALWNRIQTKDCVSVWQGEKKQYSNINLHWIHTRLYMAYCNGLLMHTTHLISILGNV